MKDDITFPKHLGIEVNSKEDVIRAIEEGLRKDTGVRYSIKEVRQHLEEQFRLARTMTGAKKSKAKVRP